MPRPSAPTLRFLRAPGALALLVAACATPPPPPPPAAPPPPVAASEDTSAQVDEAPPERLSSAPPPARRRRQFVVTEAEHLRLRNAFPRGFQPDDCVTYCRQETARTPSEDGLWIWTLRCLLDRSMRDEPIVSCREEAKPAREKGSDAPAKASTYTVIDE